MTVSPLHNMQCVHFSQFLARSRKRVQNSAWGLWTVVVLRPAAPTEFAESAALLSSANQIKGTQLWSWLRFVSLSQNLTLQSLSDSSPSEIGTEELHKSRDCPCGWWKVSSLLTCARVENSVISPRDSPWDHVKFPFFLSEEDLKVDSWLFFVGTYLF